MTCLERICAKYILDPVLRLFMGLFCEFGQVERLMVFSAHPDDESTSFGGALALSTSMGVETIVITSTDSALGDSIEGDKPENIQHNPTQVALTRLALTRLALTRRQEILHACEILGVYVSIFWDRICQ